MSKVVWADTSNGVLATCERGTFQGQPKYAVSLCRSTGQGLFDFSSCGFLLFDTSQAARRWWRGVRSKVRA